MSVVVALFEEPPIPYKLKGVTPNVIALCLNAGKAVIVRLFVKVYAPETRFAFDKPVSPLDDKVPKLPAYVRILLLL